MDLFLLSRYLSTFWQISYQSLKGPASSNNRSLFQSNLILTHYPPNTFSFDLYLGQAHIFPTIDTGKIFLLLSFSFVLQVLVFLMLTFQPTLYHTCVFLEAPFVILFHQFLLLHPQCQWISITFYLSPISLSPLLH